MNGLPEFNEPFKVSQKQTSRYSVPLFTFLLTLLIYYNLAGKPIGMDDPLLGKSWQVMTEIKIKNLKPGFSIQNKYSFQLPWYNYYLRSADDWLLRYFFIFPVFFLNHFKVSVMKLKTTDVFSLWIRHCVHIYVIITYGFFFLLNFVTPKATKNFLTAFLASSLYTYAYKFKHF